MRKNRRSARLGVAIPVKWIRRDGTRDLFALDVNAHGLFLATTDLRPPGSLLQLEVQLPDGPAPMFCTVRFSGVTVSGPGMGVEIFVVEERTRARWWAHYRELHRQQRGAQASFA